MIIYVVTTSMYYDSAVNSVWSTREKAEERRLAVDGYIEEHELDPPSVEAVCEHIRQGAPHMVKRDFQAGRPMVTLGSVDCLVAECLDCGREVVMK